MNKKDFIAVSIIGGFYFALLHILVFGLSIDVIVSSIIAPIIGFSVAAFYFYFDIISKKIQELKFRLVNLGLKHKC